MSFKQILIDCIPPAYYSDGTEAKCLLFRICNLFDVDPQSYTEKKEVKSDYNFIKDWTDKKKSKNNQKDNK